MICPTYTRINRYESMTVDEYAAFEKATTNDQFLQKDGFWWRRVRKGFYRPLAPFLPNTSSPLKPFASVVQYGLRDSTQANSYINLIVYDNMAEYLPEQLPRNIRRHLNKAQKNDLRVEHFTDLDALGDQAYAVYKSFIQRTGYKYNQERTDVHHFRHWIKALQNFPKIKFNGVFHNQNLLSFQISVLVENVLVFKTTVNSEEGIKMHAPDIQLYHDRISIKEQDNIRMIYSGYFSQLAGLNRYKLERGARVWCLPAKIEAPFPLLATARILRPKQYQFLIGFAEHKLSHDYER